MIPDAKLATFQCTGHNYFIASGVEANAAVYKFVTEVEQNR